MTLKHGLASYETALKYKHLNNGNSVGKQSADSLMHPSLLHANFKQH